MPFGAGVLISAVAYELVHEAFETSAGDGGIALALLAGSALFFGAEVLIDRTCGATAEGAGPEQPGRALGGRLAGFITTVGFAVAFGISALQ